ncbi:MAG: sulfatase-like hydrolase/transferase [Planctomycetota bacterium]
MNAASGDTRPNLVLLVVDCLRADRAYGVAGNCRNATTNGLRERGHTFTTAVSSAANTTPSFASLLSSLFGFHHGVRSLRGYKMKDTFPTLPEVLRDAGYHTVAEVSGPLIPENRLNRGFDDYVFRGNGMGLFSTFLGQLKRRVRDDDPKPFFLLLHLWSLHRPRKIRPGWDRPGYGDTRYDRSWSSLDERIGKLLPHLPENTVLALTGDHGERFNDGDDEPENFRIASRFPFLENRAEMRHERAKRRRQRHARKRGEDTGPLGGACHGFHVYEDLVRVPLIFAGPGVPAGGATPDLVRHVDIGPTLLDLAGVPIPDDFGADGRSLVPFLRGEAMGNVPAYIEATGENLETPTRWVASVRTEEMKYCRGLLNEDMPEEMYDLTVDPAEERNLAPDDPRVALMRTLFDEFVPDLAATDVETTLTKKEIEDLDDTLRALGYIE